MICGLDVYHPPYMESKSVLGFCSSYNKTSTKYWSKAIIQELGQEVTNHLQ
jgi:hypothetical protein